jgi:phosphoglycolate phosphatase
MLINFDFDGVIADTFDHLLKICQTAQTELGSGRPPVADDLRLVENLTFDGLAARLGIPETDMVRFADIAFTLQRSQVPEIKFFHGMRELLLQLQQKAKIAIITSGDTAVVRGYLVENGLGDAVSTIAGGERRLPKSTSLLDNMSRFSSTPDRTWMIGDAVSDIRQGRKAGVGTVAVSWGFQARSLLEREAPDFLVDSPQELQAILQNL